MGFKLIIFAKMVNFTKLADTNKESARFTLDNEALV